MLSINVLAVAVLAGHALAAPAPAPQSTGAVSCGNNATSWCCDTAACALLDTGSACSTDVICCPSGGLLGLCLGNLDILNNLSILKE